MRCPDFRGDLPSTPCRLGWLNDEGFTLPLSVNFPHVASQAVVLTGEHPCTRDKSELIFMEFSQPVG